MSTDNQYTFPIEYMLEAVQNSLPKMVSIDLFSGIDKGLQNEIKLIDKDGNLTDTARVSPMGQVYLSVSFCQFLLIMCHVGLYVHDSIAVRNEIEHMTKQELEQFHRELEVDCDETRYLKALSDYKSTLTYCSRLIDIAKPLLLHRTITQQEFDSLVNNIDYKSQLSAKANSLCVFGIVFLLLHEASHIILDQDLYDNGTIEEELEADHNAFWAMYSDLTDKERYTAMVGCLCALTSLLFINPNLEPDGIHPREDIRLFTFYDLLKDERTAYTEIIVILLAAWATVSEKEDFPVLDNSYEETLNRQRAYLKELGDKNESEHK